ncbi:disintegrin and metalloproteinase domain-containing protein 20-like [Molossus nigricans]
MVVVVMSFLWSPAPSLMGPACAQAHLTGDLWLPLLCLLLPQFCSSHTLPGWRFTSSEVVIPRKVSHRVGAAGVQDQLSYRIHFGGRRHVVHMKVKKNLLPRHFPVVTNNDQGAMQEDYPFVPRDCYYYSYLEGVPGSMGTLDTCYGGLRGMLQIDDFTYEIKPLEASSKFEHVVSLLVTEPSSGTERCRIEVDDADLAYEEAMLAESPRATTVYLWRTHRKSLKLHYTVSSSLFRLNPNKTLVIERVVMMNNILNSIYYQQRIHVYIRVLFLWERSDLVNVNSGSAYDIVERFGLWKYNNWYFQIIHDTSLLLTGHRLGSYSYFAFSNGVCNPNWGAMYVYVGHQHIFVGATTAAHAIGHGIGMSHDVAGCKCFRRTFCIMTPVPGLLDMFSNCSFHRIRYWQIQFDHCFASPYAPYKNFPYVAPRCGDKIINNKEECDCGSIKECTEDKCCEVNCALSLSSECSRGGCCINCKHGLPGRICREKRGICDLSEYCDGTKATCPEDFYVQDGTPCSPLSVCVRGNCSDRDMQCQALLGFEARDGAPGCYEKLNIRGDRFGNCGVKLERFGMRSQRCEPDDVYCGMLHCRDIQEIPSAGEHITFRRIIVEDAQQEICTGFELHSATDKPPLGLVVDGATCGPGRFCLNQNCTFHQDMRFDCDVKTCNFRGVCNNRKHCHCQRGWIPPTCNGTGVGGSIDSGPPPDREPGVRSKISVTINQAVLILSIRTALLMATFFFGCISSLGTKEN